jgi:hypothetical protein
MDTISVASRSLSAPHEWGERKRMSTKEAQYFLGRRLSDRSALRLTNLKTGVSIIIPRGKALSVKQAMRLGILPTYVKGAATPRKR